MDRRTRSCAAPLSHRCSERASKSIARTPIITSASNLPARSCSPDSLSGRSASAFVGQRLVRTMRLQEFLELLPRPVVELHADPIARPRLIFELLEHRPRDAACHADAGVAFLNRDLDALLGAHHELGE